MQTISKIQELDIILKVIELAQLLPRLGYGRSIETILALKLLARLAELEKNSSSADALEIELKALFATNEIVVKDLD